MFELQIDNLSKPLQPWFLRRFTSSNNYFRRYIVSKQKSFFSFFLTYCQSAPNLVVPSQLVVICRHCDFFLRHVSRNSANFVWICKILYIHISLKTSFAPSSREQWKDALGTSLRHSQTQIHAKHFFDSQGYFSNFHWHFTKRKLIVRNFYAYSAVKQSTVKQSSQMVLVLDIFPVFLFYS